MIEMPRSKQGSREINMIPMINIIFLILIYFLLSGSFEKFDLVAIEVPQAESGKVFDQGPILILLGKHEELLLDDEMITMESFESKLKKLLADNPKKVITIRADASLEARKMIDIMDRIKAAGGENLSLATQSD